MTRNSCVDRSLIVNTITDEAIDDVIHLGQQLRHLRRVLLMALRHRGGDNLPLVIDAEVQFLPALALLLVLNLAKPKNSAK